jgi:hypothetical protein
VAEAGDRTRGWAAVVRVLGPAVAFGVGLDEIARGAGALVLAREIVTWVPPFTRSHEPGIDLLVSGALLVVAWLLLRVLKSKLPKEMHGVGYVAAILAGAIACSAISDLAHHPVHAAGLTASNSSKSQPDLGSRSSRAKPSKAGTHHASGARSTASPRRRSARASEPSGPTTASSRGSSGTVSGNSASQVDAGSTVSHLGHTSRPAQQTHTPVHKTRSPGVEVESSKSATAPSSKASPTVEVKSEQEHPSGIEVASN